MSIVIGEDAFDRLPETVRMKQDLGDPARRTAVREEYKQGLPKFYPDIGEELQLTAEQVDRLFDPGCDHFGASRGCLRCF